MSAMILRDESSCRVAARDDGLVLLSATPADADATSLVTVDARILLEQGLARDMPDGVLVPWEDWGLAVSLGARSLTAFTHPSHLLLEVDRLGELGRPDFQYVMRWREGTREIAVERVGAYLRHPASGRQMHLDPRTLALVEAMSRFNALSPEQRRQAGSAWGTLGTVQREAAECGALLDAHLQDNAVVIPSSLGLTIRDEEDGSVTFLPRIPDLVAGPDLVARFEQALSIGDVLTVTDASRRRVRILLSDAQQEVLRRMKQVRRLGGEVGQRLRADPVQAFDGVAHAINLSDIALEYGPRVIGVGPLELPSDVRADRGPTIFDRIGRPATPDAPADATGDAPPPAAEAPLALAPLRTAVALDVIDTASGQATTLRLRGPEEVAALHEVVEWAVARGDETVTFNGCEFMAEPALAEALRRHVSRPPGAPAEGADVGHVGRTGHLYLLINEHEETLTDALRVPEGDAVEMPALVLKAPAALSAEVRLQPHQDEGVAWLATCRAIPQRRGAILADDMGLGKTLQLLTHIASLVEGGALDDGAPTASRNGPWRPVLIVAPLLLVETGTWTEEMSRRFRDGGRVFEPWLVLRDEGLRKVMRVDRGRDLLGKPLLDPDKLMAHKVVITTYETLMAYQHSLAQRVGGRPMWSLVIFDEAHEVKSPQTKQSYAAKALDARFKIAATGTPVETRLRDLWNLLDTVEPTLLGTQRDFVATYERPAMNAADAAQRAAALDALRARLRYQRPGAVLLRRDKGILDGLPPKEEHRLRCAMTDLERATVAGLLRGTRRRGSALKLLQQLHLASQHPVLAGASGNVYDVEGLIRSSSRLHATVKVLRDIEARGEKALIFARSVAAQRMLAHVVEHEFRRPVSVINGQSHAVGATRFASAGVYRRQTIDAFRRTPGFGVIVLSPFVAGVGLTLVEANHVIHYGRWWNPAIESQATDRAYRIGQRNTVHVYLPIGMDPTGEIPQTFDEALDDLLRERQSLARDFLMPAGEDAMANSLLQSLARKPTPRDLHNSAPPVVDWPDTPEQTTALVLAIAAARGERAVWLGNSGRYGIHVLRKTGDGLRATRIVEEVTGSDVEVLRSGAETWQRILGVPAYGELLGRTSAEGVAVRSLTWSQLRAEANSVGIGSATAWSPPHEATPLSDVRAMLS